MVRLLLQVALKGFLRYSCFNPTMVRLLQIKKEVRSNVDKSFNPTMVRLLLTSYYRNMTPVPAFQSHYGAIATARSSSTRGPAIAVSIPLWCDCYLLYDELAAFTFTGFNPTMVRLLLIGAVGAVC